MRTIRPVGCKVSSGTTLTRVLCICTRSGGRSDVNLWVVTDVSVLDVSAVGGDDVQELSVVAIAGLMAVSCGEGGIGFRCIGRLLRGENHGRKHDQQQKMQARMKMITAETIATIPGLPSRRFRLCSCCACRVAAAGRDVEDEKNGEQSRISEFLIARKLSLLSSRGDFLNEDGRAVLIPSFSSNSTVDNIGKGSFG